MGKVSCHGSQLIGSEETETSFDNQPTQSPDSAPPGLVNLLKHMQAHAEFYRVMLGNQGDPSFCAKSFRGYIERGFRRMLSSQTFQADPSRPPVDLTVNYLLSAGVGAIVWWLEKDQLCSPEQMANWLYQLSMASINVSLGRGQ